ncbi:hypothetical protein [Deinococcus sedimenti]|uniref:ATPase dynein-related AAA domain-containing protein n=1 Tax=Deinococcus sedimenti TaxID=1867090 RepID=A0ABQ2S8R3_9DEIO|nr:hypothetical protein [Deinococcus sedimenti]GGS05723.1 hypothetical protein GCM10008960_35280 [Deinococcus sedimenti]
MSKKNKNKFNARPASPQPATPAPTGAAQGPSFTQALDVFSQQYGDLLRGASPEEQAQAAAAPTDMPAAEPQAELERRFKQVTEALALLESRKRTLDAKVAEADAKTGAAEKRGEELKKDRATFDADRQALQAERRQVDLDRRQLVQREEDLVAREADAEAGFLHKREAALSELRAEIERLTTEGSRLHQHLLTERETHEQTLREAREAHAAELRRRESDFEVKVGEARDAAGREMHQLQARQLKLEREVKNLEFEKEDLEEERRHLKTRARQEVARDLEKFEAQIRELQGRLDTARGERDALARTLDAQAQATLQFGGRTPDDILRELHTLRGERDQLRSQLNARPSEDTVHRLRLLETERTDWEAKRLQDGQTISELRQRLERAGIAVTELETLRDHKLSLETQATLLRTALRELKADVDKHITSAEGKVVFPACTDLDAREALHEVLPLDEQLADLGAFVQGLQVRMASDERQPLQYSLDTLRTFVAGLAMSRLHLLQGISGTGKTSLPLAFARATGGFSSLTEVQSGWRDKADLIGHFNAFERRFYEAEFLQALYKATLPRYRDIPVMLVLDEMNLSQTEHYFASILSILENPERQQLILMEAPVSPSPRNLTDGRILDLPDNVWFIGTANHDESTKDFADKTYDRAHVMELPRHPAQVQPQRSPERAPLSFTALQGAFREAQRTHEAAADQAYTYLETELGGVLHDRFGLNWGNRLERQVRAFVPVMVAAGGTVAQATDHILASKVLRKIQNQFDVRPDDLTELQHQLRKTWPRLGGQPEQSHRCLEQALRRLGVSPVTA